MLGNPIRSSLLVFALCLAFFNAFAGQRLRYTFEKGKAYSYSSVIETKTFGQAMGQEYEFTSSGNLGFTMTSLEEKEHMLSIMMTVDRYDMRINIPLMGFNDSTMVMKEYLGKRIRIMMTDAGKVISIEPLDTIPASRMQVNAGLHPMDLFTRLIFELPEKDVDTNGTWKRDFPDTLTQSRLKIISKHHLDYSVAGSEVENEFPCWKITFGGNGTVEGRGKQQGAEVTIDGTNAITGVAYFAPAAGVFVSSSQSVENDMTVTATGAESSAQTMTTTVSVKTSLTK